MKGRAVIGGVTLAVLAVGIVLLFLRGSSSTSFVERHGATLIVHGQGAQADLGYLAAGRYELTIDQNEAGCANSVTLTGEDGVEWFQLDPHLINYKDFATTRRIPGQRYWMRVSTYFGGGGLGPRATPTPIASCSWVFELTPVATS